jgi:hypothetical protein
VALVESLPAAPEPLPEQELVTVHEAGDPADVALVESLLADAGIAFVKQGDSLQDLFGAGRLGTGFSPIVGPIRFVVRADQAEAARELLRASSAEGPADAPFESDSE